MTDLYIKFLIARLSEMMGKPADYFKGVPGEELEKLFNQKLAEEKPSTDKSNPKQLDIFDFLK